MTLHNRIGKVSITEQLIKQSTGIFKKFNPIRIDTNLNGIFEYTCYSELFDELEEGQLIPRYYIVVKRHKNGTLTITADKINDPTRSNPNP